MAGSINHASAEPQSERLDDFGADVMAILFREIGLNTFLSLTAK